MMTPLLKSVVVIQFQLRDLKQGTKRHDRRRSYDMVEVAKMEHRSLQYLYSEGDEFLGTDATSSTGWFEAAQTPGWI